MESGGVQILMSPVPGQRVTSGKDPEDGSILAFRDGGDECLFASWEADAEDDARGRGMLWIPVAEFSPDPESIRPPEIVEGQEQEPADETGTTERDPGHGPMGGSTRPTGGLRRRPTVEG